jgi:hypothetical protein
MKMSRNSFLGKFIQHTYGYVDNSNYTYSYKTTGFNPYESGPRNTCQLILYTVFGILIFPFCFPFFISNSIVVSRINKFPVQPACISIFIFIFFGLVAVTVISGDQSFSLGAIYLYWLAGITFLTVVGVLVSALFLLCAWVVSLIFDLCGYLYDKIPYINKRSFLLYDVNISGFKKKICKDVKWED